MRVEFSSRLLFNSRLGVVGEDVAVAVGSLHL
jgi:hypothetical protein